MESTTTDSMCRCCAAEGIFKDIKTSYHWMGEEEVYGDMLRECFDVKLAAVEEGGICEVCITQLRNAANFKKQVLHTEKKFKRHLENRRFKPTEVKEEVSGDNGNSSDDNDRGVDSEDDEDYVPEFEIPIKTESPEETKSRKRAAKATTSRAKKSRSADAEDKSFNASTVENIKMEIEISCGLSIKVEQPDIDDFNSQTIRPRPIETLLETPREEETVVQRNKAKHSTEKSARSELAKHRHNIRTILQCSNATPIRTHFVGSGYICAFCKAYFPKAADLKNHTIVDHDEATKNKFMQNSGLVAFAVKLDITQLTCNICEMLCENLEHLIDHLNRSHQKGLHTDIKSHIACFKLDEESMKCHICYLEFNSFKHLQGHMTKHFSNFICDVCSAGFINRRQLGIHADTHRMGAHECSACGKVFSSSKKLKRHDRQAHSAFLGQYKCFHCGEKFKNRNTKKKHMITSHGTEFADLKCSDCDRTFKSSKSLHFHKKKDHMMVRYACKLCDSVFCRADKLRFHELVHTGVRMFECDLCSKTFTRKCTLKEHIRSHENDCRRPLKVF